MTKFDKTTFYRFFKSYGHYVAVGVVVLAGVYWEARTILIAHEMKVAQDELQKGFGALAAERLDSYRDSLIRRDDGCKELLTAYYQTRKFDRLEWASQACIEAKHEIPEDYLALAAVREETSREPEAIQILAQAAQKFDKVPDFYYRLGQIFQKEKKDQQAAVAYSRAVERAPANNQMAFDVLQYFSKTGHWNEARPLADRLKNVKTDDPEVKLVLARALMHGGDIGSAQAQADEAKKLLEKNPAAREALEQAYGDVLHQRNLASDTK